MRKVLLLIPLAIFLVLAGFFLHTLWSKSQQEGPASSSIELPSPLIGKPFPEFSLPSVEEDGPTITEEDLKGQPALVNVWATWCVACRAEHPVLNRLAEQGVVIHGVNYKDDSAAARSWLKDFHDPYQLDVADTEGRLGIDLGVYGAPETYLIDAEGIIRYKFIGVIDDRVWKNKLGPRYQALLDGEQP
ncbi:cytochrome c biogenesis protein CcmG, thiol:disulfide interchange protein DsbE [Halopseudomonas xinjiangensis]|uniref:Cytochrome c biogenesis protein CcmG, thiol:disulfide interchange protein DsbE n=1 Tax=Halopseudomonas xinjiangensis TaxID=487184 RepID=A0A1H1NDU1_9GAMM|nr:DsbE family thiol:disulfide interchange protein [Halopseudomonas xinjiangensis]SDR96945.1 cytochrome c biogenesis protein CcmG, thiol:disulfide interchange protein DsbE [Halopseudomonas xinjiangensis]